GEHVAEVERDPARQRLQAEDTEQATDAGLELVELAGAGLQAQPARQAGVVDPGRRPAPGELAGEARGPAAHHVRVAEAMDQRTHRCGLQAEVELRALADACAPLPPASEPSIRIFEREAI